MVPLFWSHGRRVAVVTRTGAAPVHAATAANTQVLYLFEFEGDSPTNMKGL